MPVLNATPLPLGATDNIHQHDLPWIPGPPFIQPGDMGPNMDENKCQLMYMDNSMQQHQQKQDPNMNNITSFNPDHPCSLQANSDMVSVHAPLPTSSSAVPCSLNGKAQCNGCGRGIEDRYIFRIMDGSWHEQCLHCSECGHTLAEKCFVKNSKLYCKEDYDRIYGARCSGCGDAIPKHDLVMRVMPFIYHLRCFACCYCHQQLQRGDQFVLKDDGRLYCPMDYDRDRMYSMHMYGGSKPGDMDWNTPYSPKSDCDSLLDDQDGDQPKGPKRPRTILTTSQRRKFKLSFEVNPKPCRKVRETLAQETGLSVRVVQVWFQNQRAKMKKIARKQQNKDQGTDKDGKTKKSNKKKEDGDSDSESLHNDSACSIGQSESGLFDNASSSQHNKLDSLEDVFMNQASQSGIGGAAGGGGGSGAHQGPIVNPIDKLYSMQTSYFSGE